MNVNRNAKLRAIASVLAASAVLTSAAEAGGGIRLGFGGPLGTFVATPAHGGGGSYQAKKIKKAPAMQAARKERTPAQRVAKAETPQKNPKADVSAATESGQETTARERPSVTGSSALIQGSIPAAEPATPDTGEPTVTAKTDVAPDEPESCKRFIPAVGMTVSVGCE